jgi:hypothetical protein
MLLDYKCREQVAAKEESTAVIVLFFVFTSEP